MNTRGHLHETLRSVPRTSLQIVSCFLNVISHNVFFFCGLWCFCFYSRSTDNRRRSVAFVCVVFFCFIPCGPILSISLNIANAFLSTHEHSHTRSDCYATNERSCHHFAQRNRVDNTHTQSENSNGGAATDKRKRSPMCACNHIQTPFPHDE